LYSGTRETLYQKGAFHHETEVTFRKKWLAKAAPHSNKQGEKTLNCVTIFVE